MNNKVRLGYACVNMGLTNRKKNHGGKVTTSRTARKATWQLGSGIRWIWRPTCRDL